jgi:polysaccharide export outer membrane protein
VKFGKEQLVRILVLVSGVVVIQAAVGQTAEKPGADSALQMSPLAAVRLLETSTAEEYTIGDGDEIEIQAANRPELSGHHLVGPDGRITLPLSGSLQIRSMTREEAARAIAKSFLRYYDSVDVTVRVSKYGSNRVLVLGHVSQPGVLYFDNAPTLLEALSKSHPTSAKGSNGGESSLPNHVSIFRGKDQVIRIDLKALLDQGSSGVDVRLRRDDILYVPDEQDDLVSVLGEVQHPGMVKLESNTTLLDVLAMSGGLMPAAGAAKIQVLRQTAGTTREVAFQDLMNPAKAREISLHRGDVIYVQKGAMAKFEYVMEKLTPLSTMLLFGSTLSAH